MKYLDSMKQLMFVSMLMIGAPSFLQARDFGAGLAVGGFTGLATGAILGKASNSSRSGGYSSRDIRKMKKKIARLEDALDERDERIVELEKELAALKK